MNCNISIVCIILEYWNIGQNDKIFQFYVYIILIDQYFSIPLFYSSIYQSDIIFQFYVYIVCIDQYFNILVLYILLKYLNSLQDQTSEEVKPDIDVCI